MQYSLGPCVSSRSRHASIICFVGISQDSEPLFCDFLAPSLQPTTRTAPDSVPLMTNYILAPLYATIPYRLKNSRCYSDCPDLTHFSKCTTPLLYHPQVSKSRAQRSLFIMSARNLLSACCIKSALQIRTVAGEGEPIITSKFLDRQFQYMFYGPIQLDISCPRNLQGCCGFIARRKAAEYTIRHMTCFKYCSYAFMSSVTSIA